MILFLLLISSRNREAGSTSGEGETKFGHKTMRLRGKFSGLGYEAHMALREMT